MQPPPQQAALWLLAASLVICLLGRAAADIQVNAQWVSNSPEGDAAVSDTGALSSILAQGMGGVYSAAGLPANLGAAVSVDGQILPGATYVPPPTTKSAPAPPPPPAPTPAPTNAAPAAQQQDSGASTILVASLVVGVVGLLGVVAWALMSRNNSKKEQPGPAVIPARIAPPPAYYAPPPQPEPSAPPAYYAPPPPPAYYAPPPPPAYVYYPPPAPDPPCPPPPQPRKVFRIVVRR